MGIYLLNYITILKYNLRGVIMRVKKFLIANDNLYLRVKGINNGLLMMGDASCSEYLGIRGGIHRSKCVYIDETSFHVEVSSSGFGHPDRHGMMFS